MAEIMPGTNLTRGIASGIAAGALWGIVFIAPEILTRFTAVELVIGRYALYGLISALILLPSLATVRAKVETRDLLNLLRLGLSANIIYYLFLALAVHLVGVAPVALIVGMLPITVTLFGTRETGALSVKELWLPLVLVLVGLLAINIDVFTATASLDRSLLDRSLLDKGLGLLAAFGALASWTDYAVRNARYLRQNSKFTSKEWSLLSGVATGALSLCLLPIVFYATSSQEFIDRPWGLFLEVNLLIAVGSSVIGNSFWNAASRYLPLTLSGQMIIFETLFALLYGFLLEARFPHLFEWLAIILLTGGVILSARLHRGR